MLMLTPHQRPRALLIICCLLVSAVLMAAPQNPSQPQPSPAQQPPPPPKPAAKPKKVWTDEDLAHADTGTGGLAKQALECPQQCKDDLWQGWQRLEAEPDSYAVFMKELADVIDETRKDDSWYAALVEIASKKQKVCELLQSQNTSNSAPVRDSSSPPSSSRDTPPMDPKLRQAYYELGMAQSRHDQPMLMSAWQPRLRIYYRRRRMRWIASTTCPPAF
jgi:hypothetical protein